MWSLWALFSQDRTKASGDTIRIHVTHLIERQQIGIAADNEIGAAIVFPSAFSVSSCGGTPPELTMLDAG